MESVRRGFFPVKLSPKSFLRLFSHICHNLIPNHAQHVVATEHPRRRRVPHEPCATFEQHCATSPGPPRRCACPDGRAVGGDGRGPGTLHESSLITSQIFNWAPSPFPQDAVHAQTRAILYRLINDEDFENMWKILEVRDA